VQYTFSSGMLEKPPPLCPSRYGFRRKKTSGVYRITGPNISGW
jgi:hypothetical protein